MPVVEVISNVMYYV